MSELMTQKIDSLPPLPKTIMEIEDFRGKVGEKEPFELLKIIEKDALIISTLLKVSNSAMFGFRSKVETPSRAINLLGVNFTISIAIGGTVQNLLQANLDPYGISTDDFMDASNLASSLVNLWVAKIDYDLKEELLLPALLQETGKFIVADVIANDDKTDDFKQAQSNGSALSDVEKEFVGKSSAEITADIFRHWKLSENLINAIEFVDNLKDCPEDFLQKAKILYIIKTACEITDPLSDSNCEKALAKAKEFGFNTKDLAKAFDTLQTRLLDAL